MIGSISSNPEKGGVLSESDSTQEAQKPSKEEQDQAFRDEQKRQAELQGQTAENAVPEQRPQASQQFDGPPHSELTEKLKEAGDPNIPVDEPMGQEAYDRADSDAQKRKAAKDSKSEGLMVGNRCRATKGAHEGRIFAVTRIVSHGSVADLIRQTSGSPEQLYNSPKELELRAIGDERDGETVILDVEEAGLEKLNEDWAGSRAGRRH